MLLLLVLLVLLVMLVVLEEAVVSAIRRLKLQSFCFCFVL